MTSNHINSICVKYCISQLVHLSHLDNCQSILEHGILCFNTVLDKAIQHKSVADDSVQKRRGYRYLTINETKMRINVHDFVPLFFATHTPMQYVITKSAYTKGREAVITNEELIFFLVGPVQVLQLDRTLFSDGNVASNNTRLFTDANRLNEIDWDVIREDNAYPQCYDPEWKRKKSSEVLIYKSIPPSAFKAMIAYSELAKSRVIANCTMKSLSGLSNRDLESLIQVNKSYYL